MPEPCDEKLISTLTLRLPKSVRENIAKQAKEEGVSVGLLVRRLIERGTTKKKAAARSM
mgnify:CR=1 FL=1